MRDFMSRNIVNIIAASCVAIVAVLLGFGVVLGQCLDVNAVLAHEVKLMRVQQKCDGEVLKQLEMERAYRQNRVRVE